MRFWSGRHAIGVTALVNLLILGLGLATSVTSARSLGPEGRGIFSIAWAVSSFAVVVLGLGMSRSLTYFVSKDTRSAGAAWRLTVLTGVGLGVPVALMATIAVHLVVSDRVQAHALMLGLGAIPFAIISANATGILQGLRWGFAFNVSRLLTPVAFASLLVVWALTRPGSAVEAIGVYVLATALGMAGSVALMKARIGDARHAKPGFAQAVLRYGLVTNVGLIAYVANRHLLLITLGFVATAADVGVFSVAMGYALPVSAAATAIALHTMPEIAATTDPARQARLGRRRIVVTVKATIPTAALAMVAAPFLIPLAFGDEFSRAVEIGLILVAAQAVFAVGSVLEETSRGLGKPGFPALAEGIGLLATIVATVLIVPSTGISGAAVAALAVNAAVAAVLYSRLRPYLRPSAR